MDGANMNPNIMGSQDRHWIREEVWPGTPRRLEPCREARSAERPWRKSSGVKPPRESSRAQYNPGRFFAVVATVFFAAAASLPAAAEILGKSGDIGSITVPIANNPLSFAADNVRITISAPPGLDLQVLGTSQLGPLAVSPGTTALFLIDYQIGPNATDGSYELQIHPTYDGALTYIQQPTLDTSVHIRSVLV